MNKLQYIAQGEPKLVEEIRQILDTGNNLPLARQRGIDAENVRAVVLDFASADIMPHVEAVILPFMRPVLFIRNGKIDLPDSNELKERIMKYKPMIEQPLNAVGRIELKNHQLQNIGTGWLIAENIIATNRHVAELFCIRGGSNAFGGVFRRNFMGQPLLATIDFKEEYHTSPAAVNEFELEIEKVVYLPDASRDLPDIALLKIKKSPMQPAPIPFLKEKLSNEQFIGVVGYPLQDPRGVVDREMEKRIFGDVFGVKRYAPGKILDVPDNHWYFLHDASTLGGNSGSLVQDMESGCAIGIHFAGSLLEANFAVKGQEILDISTKVGLSSMFSFTKKQADSVAVEPDFAQEKPFTIPDYNNRKGFSIRFLENDQGIETVPLPKIKHRADILKFGPNNKNSILKYAHFSVAISKSRRICIYSAVNIDGMQYKRIKRTGWRFDPRIPEEYQIMKECYGNAPKFSRGHMTRREDPNWGELAQVGNDDSMHVTNAVPQMQNFNAGVWLSLENFALENAKHDKQRICVFTGPFLYDSDPEKFGVKIPVEFWKVIAFIHDETGQLTATGYTISQENYLRNDEFVFGEFMTYQVPINLIEKKAGISFGALSKADPLKDDIFETISAPVQSVRQIRFY
ncbi:MAG: DNA/RNA non-specific endonuclease [Haliscomenobacter sp.]|nr:DNA/RNA non-specific endonuclease [Haliscomenobacter sp.]MBK8880098.1 DNA/RNA non-specific endonuclease [Haliscomenobacter sp.]